MPSASCASIKRQFEGFSPDCASARTAPAPFRKSANFTEAEARNAGVSCSLTHASVITPKIPSEPMSSRSGCGPAPEPGKRRVSIKPAGVTTRIASTKSSICVVSVA